MSQQRRKQATFKRAGPSSGIGHLSNILCFVIRTFMCKNNSCNSSVYRLQVYQCVEFHAFILDCFKLPTGIFLMHPTTCLPCVVCFCSTVFHNQYLLADLEKEVDNMLSKMEKLCHCAPYNRHMPVKLQQEVLQQTRKVKDDIRKLRMLFQRLVRVPFNN